MRHPFSLDLPKPQSLGFPTDLGLGDEAVVTCFAKKSSSLPANPLSLSWHKDGAPISSEARISLVRVSQNSLALSIKSVLPEDIGNYTCVAEGPTGSSTVTVPLVVSGAQCTILPLFFFVLFFYSAVGNICTFIL